MRCHNYQKLGKGAKNKPNNHAHLAQDEGTNSDFEVDSAINSEGELIHSVLIIEAKPVEFDKTVTEEKLLKAMKEEINFIEKNQTWELVDPPSNKKPIALKWVHKVRVNPRGEVKVRIDYREVYAPIARIETIRLVVVIATNAS
ncbi:hypothetical protein CR513_09170, partial [Mucuna pruriens]